jgi:hypothetical protein
LERCIEVIPCDAGPVPAPQRRWGDSFFQRLADFRLAAKFAIDYLAAALFGQTASRLRIGIVQE